MKRRDLVQKIEELGCVLIRHGAKHDWYQNPRTRMAQPVPRHREIKEFRSEHLEEAFLTSNTCAASADREDVNAKGVRRWDAENEKGEDPNGSSPSS